jgi:hypothetical protein
MDLSKLPKLSKTGEAQESSRPNEMPAAEPTPTAAPSAPAQSLAVGGWIEAWVSIGIGLFLLLFWPRFLQWLSSRLFHTHFDEFIDNNNNVIPYQTLPVFWSDLGPTLFGIALVIDGLLMFTRRRGFYWFAFGLTIAATTFNLLWVVISYSNYGLAPISFLAVIFGVIMAVTQWRALHPTHVVFAAGA